MPTDRDHSPAQPAYTAYLLGVRISLLGHPLDGPGEMDGTSPQENWYQLLLQTPSVGIEEDEVDVSVNILRELTRHGVGSRLDPQ
jgi:hypothetical protein